MSTDLQLDKKDILSNPVAAFSRYQPNSDIDAVSALDTLWQQAQSLQQQQTTIKTSTKILSREIGQAKRNNGPINHLMASMHELSTQLKTIKNDLTDIEHQIINYFDINDYMNDTTAASTSKYYERVYPDLQSDERAISIAILENEQDDWNSYVTKNTAASIYHRYEWKELAKKCYGLESHYLIARYDDRTVAGILPLVRLKSIIFGDYLVSMPYFMRGGAIADHPSIEQQLMLSANEYAAKLGVEHIEYRDDVPHEKFPVRTDKVHMVLQLPDTAEKLWKSFTPKLRSQIRRPQRENPQVYFGRNEYLDDFYTVYARNMRDLGSPVHSEKFIRNILLYFPENSCIAVVYLDNKPVAAGLLLQQDRKMDIPLASTIRDVNPLGINMLMYWEILKFSIDKGCTKFDFGRSSKDSGTFRFKQQWGAQQKQLYLHYWLPKDNEIPSLNHSNPKYALLIRIWKLLPVKLTKWVGPPIVKNLP